MLIIAFTQEGKVRDINIRTLEAKLLLLKHDVTYTWKTQEKNIRNERQNI